MFEYKTARRVLVFDTETTGLIAKHAPIRAQPYILQLSFVVYDLQEKSTLRTYCEYIRISDEVAISPESANIHGITKEMCGAGVRIESALAAIRDEYLQCDVIVGHNISFDKEMVMIECDRNLIEFNFDSKPTYCTMREGIHMCNIMVSSKLPGKSPRLKFPRLAELYMHLFGEKFDNAHDALADTLATLRCFIAMV